MCDGCGCSAAGQAQQQHLAAAFRTWGEFVKERQQALKVLQLVQSHWVRSPEMLQPGCAPRVAESTVADDHPVLHHFLSSQHRIRRDANLAMNQPVQMQLTCCERIAGACHSARCNGSLGGAHPVAGPQKGGGGTRGAVVAGALHSTGIRGMGGQGALCARPEAPPGALPPGAPQADLGASRLRQIRSAITAG